MIDTFDAMIHANEEWIKVLTGRLAALPNAGVSGAEGRDLRLRLAYHDGITSGLRQAKFATLAMEDASA